MLYSTSIQKIMLYLKQHTEDNALFDQQASRPAGQQASRPSGLLAAARPLGRSADQPLSRSAAQPLSRSAAQSRSGLVKQPAIPSQSPPPSDIYMYIYIYTGNGTEPKPNRTGPIQNRTQSDHELCPNKAIHNRTKAEPNLNLQWRTLRCYV